MSETKDWLVYSNFTYLLPALIIAFRVFYTKKMDFFNGIELLTLLITVGLFTSYGYHICQQDFQNTHHKQPDTHACESCPNESWPPGMSDITYENAKFLDHFLANFTVFMVLIYILPLKPDIKTMLRIFGMLWIVMSTVRNHDDIAQIPTVFITFGLLFPFWWYSGGLSRNISWSIGMILILTALWAFKQPNYNLYHGIWHVCGALSAASFLWSGVPIAKTLPNIPYFNFFFLKSVI